MNVDAEAGEAFLVGAIEAGGTKFVCAVGSAARGPVEMATIPTRSPDETFADVAAFFRSVAHHGRPGAIGVGSFGPLELDPASSDYGRILRTPKPGWEGVDLIGRTRAIAGVAVALDTDVNAAALAEAAAAGDAISSLAYVTVGTGIGVGLVVDGRPVHGLGHPEAGHMLPRRHPSHDGFAGTCPFHGDCLEGLASGTAIRAAWGPASSFPAEHPFWEAEAWYLAQLCASLFLTASPARIVLGGGVMNQQRLFAPVRRRTVDILGGYLQRISGETIDALIVPPGCAVPSGLMGALLLGERAGSLA